MVTIATFNEPDKAKRLKQRFQEAGLKADIHNEGHLQAVAFMSRPRANAKIMVDDIDFERAHNLMIEWETSDPDVAAAIIRCPQCGSSNIEYPQMTRKFMTPALVGLLCALKIIPKEFYCQDCHYTWSNDAERTIGRLRHRSFPARRGSQGLIGRSECRHSSFAHAVARKRGIHRQTRRRFAEGRAQSKIDARVDHADEQFEWHDASYRRALARLASGFCHRGSAQTKTACPPQSRRILQAIPCARGKIAGQSRIQSHDQGRRSDGVERWQTCRLRHQRIYRQHPLDQAQLPGLHDLFRSRFGASGLVAASASTRTWPRRGGCGRIEQPDQQ